MFDHEVLREITGEAATADVVAFSDDELCVGIRSIVSARRGLDAAEAHLLAELEVRKVCEAEFGLTTAAWFGQQADMPRGAARGRVRVANTMRRSLGVTDERLTAGSISWEQAKVMADATNKRIEQPFAEIQDELLDAAAGVGVDQWRREVDGFARLMDADGGHNPRDDIETNRLHLRHHGGGVNMNGMFVGEHEAITTRAVEQVADELFRQFTRDAERNPEITVPSRSTLQALAFSELCRRGLACDLESSRPLMPEAVMVIRADDAFDQVSTVDGVRVEDGSIRTLRCAADLTALVVDSLDVPLAMGRTIRLANRSQRTALAVRDGGCTFPGCTAPVRWCDAHHMPDWEHGGSTDVAGMALLCRRHHGVAHRSGWSSQIDDDGWTSFTTARGAVIAGQRHGRLRSQAGSATGDVAHDPTQARDGPERLAG